MKNLELRKRELRIKDRISHIAYRMSWVALTFCILNSQFSILEATQLSFNSGRLSELIKYRVDLDKRSMGAEQMDNFLVSPKGRASRRPGTEFVDDANDTVNVRLIPFEYSMDDAYVLEFGDTYIGFLRTTQ